jgi:GT2 family glycosyltransferase
METPPLTSMENPFFSVIIPTRGRQEELTICLQQLLCRQTGVSELPWECLVMHDDTPPGQPLVRLKASDRIVLRHLEGPRHGPAANRNAGAAMSQGRWLVFVDDDCVPDPGFLSGYLGQILRHPHLRALEGRTYPDRPRRSLIERGPFNEAGGCFYSCNMAVRRDLFEVMGGFDQDYAFSLEDLDFYTRLRKRGEPTAFVSDASVMHPQKEGLGWGFFRAMQRGRRTYRRKHPDQARSYSCEQMWKIWLHEVLCRLPSDTWRCRGRGLGRRLVYEVLAFLSPLLLKLPERSSTPL